MPKKFLKFSISKESLKAFTLLLNAFVWFFMASIIIIPTILNGSNIDPIEKILVWTGYYLAIIVSSLVGSVISSKISRFTLIYSWIILGVVISPVPLLFNNFTILNLLTICILLGASLGFGMPSCLAYFAESTTIDNRGKTSGITFLVTNLLGAFIAVSFGVFELSTNLLIIFFMVWRATALIIIFLKGDKKIVSENKKNPSFSLYFKTNRFLCSLLHGSCSAS